MKKNTKLVGLKLSMIAVLSLSSVALAENGLMSPSEVVPMAIVTKTVNPALTVLAAGHVVNGVALRNMISGAIATRGIPAAAPIKAAYLYWNYADSSAVGPATENIVFNGHLVTGNKTADHADLCWGTAGTHTYRAYVAAFIPLANPNQDYYVGMMGVTTNGLNPWAPLPPATTRKNNGAALVVFYGGVGVVGDAMLYDAFSGSAMTSGTHTFTLTHAAALSGAAEFSMVGADGQRGGGHNNTSSNETGRFNTVQFSGPPVAASDWDGSAGLPLPQLWDVHTHNVTLNSLANSVVSYTTPSDCVAPVAFIIDKK